MGKNNLLEISKTILCYLPNSGNYSIAKCSDGASLILDDIGQSSLMSIFDNQTLLLHGSRSEELEQRMKLGIETVGYKLKFRDPANLGYDFLYVIESKSQD